ncbi:MAG: ATP-binding protein [Terriglobia bacterium]
MAGPTPASDTRLGYASTSGITQNRPVEDWGKLLGDIAAVTAMLDRLLRHGRILKCGPRSWRSKSQTAPSAPEKP